MKKRILSFLTLLCISVALLPTNVVFAATTSGTCGDNLTWYLNSSGTLTISGTGDMTDWASGGYVPWYSLRENIKTVVIGDNVTRIGNCAFKGYSNLTTVKIGSSVKTIGYEAFDNSPHISAITIPDSVESIEQYAFEDCYGILVVTIGKGLKSIGRGAFKYNETSEYIIDPENPYFQAIDGNIFNKDGTVLVRYAIGKNEESYIIPDGVTTIDDWAFASATSLKNITIPKTVTHVKDSAFWLVDSYNNKYYLKNVYYNGTEEDWGNITIYSYNSFMTEATKIYFAYINIFDKDGNKVIDTTQNMGEYVDTSSITVPNGYAIKLYKNQALTEEYSFDTPISENLNLYYDIIEINKLKITGAESADIGQKGITESVTFATDKTAKDFVATIKFSDKLNLSTITEKNFSITENLSETKNGYTYLYLTCTYKNNGNMPKNTTLNAFDLVFDVSESATVNEKLTIEFVNDETFLADSGNNTYDFDGLGTAEIKVNPILVKSVTINGADEIDKATQYTAVISPENATNKDIEWSVDNSEIATISADGTLTPVKAGTVKITATAKDGNDVYAEKSVNVKVYAQITSLTANIGVWNKEFTPSEREYTIYVPKDTNSIKLNPQYNGTLNLGTQTLYNNRKNNITLTGGETVLTLTYSETGYTDSEYKIKIVKFEGTKTTVSDNGTKFTVIPINIKGGTVILALYNGDTFVEMQSKPYNGDDTFTTDKAYTIAKVMVWDSLESMTPICDVEIVK